MALTACANAGRTRPDPRAEAPDPIIQRQLQRELYCPAEVELDIPPEEQPEPGVVVGANVPGDDYLDRKDAREDLLAGRLRDAQAACAEAKAARDTGGRE